MNSFFESQLCKQQNKCHECRLSKSYRKGILLAFDEPKKINFACPLGRTKKDFDPLPGPVTMAKNALKAAKKVVDATVHGEDQFVNGEESDKRLAICKECDHRTIKGNKLMCAVCGCFLNFKTRLATEACPKGKWCSTLPHC